MGKKKILKRNHNRNKLLLWGIAVAVIILVIAGGVFFYYRSHNDRSQQVVLTVGGHAIQMDYFLKRIKMAGDDPNLVLQQVTYEEVVMLIAPQYGITVTPSDIDSELRKEASAAVQGSLTEEAFEKWYVVRLEGIDLLDAEYREIVRSNILAVRLGEYLAKEIPNRAEQVHLYTIMTATQAESNQAMSRINNGENFSAIADEVSTDTQTKAKGGELGWIPRGVTPYDEVIFKIETGQAAGPVAVDPDSSASGYLIFLVSEKDPDRVIEASQLEVLKSRALYNLILQQVPQHVKYSYTPEDNEWVWQQLEKELK